MKKFNTVIIALLFIIFMFPALAGDLKDYVQLINKDVFLTEYEGSRDIPHIKIPKLAFETYCVQKDSMNNCVREGLMIRNCSEIDCLPKLLEIIKNSKKQYIVNITNNYAVILKSGKKIYLNECDGDIRLCTGLDFNYGNPSYKFVKLIKNQYILASTGRGFKFILINLHTGEKITVKNTPIFSPDGFRFITMCQDSDLFMLYDSMHTEIYNLDNNKFELEFSIQCYDYKDTDVRKNSVLTRVVSWQNNNQINIKISKGLDNLNNSNPFTEKTLMYFPKLKKWELVDNNPNIMK